MLSNSDIQKLLAVFASKDDLKGLATKEDLKKLATKEDLMDVENRLGKRINKVDTELKDLNKKVDTIVEFTFEVDEDTNRRLKRVEKHLNLPQIQT